MKHALSAARLLLRNDASGAPGVEEGVAVVLLPLLLLLFPVNNFCATTVKKFSMICNRISSTVDEQHTRVRMRKGNENKRKTQTILS